MPISEKMLKIAKSLNINTTGKSESILKNEIKETIDRLSKDTSHRSGGEDMYLGLIKSVGRMFGEYEKLKHDFNTNITQTREEVTAPINEIKKDVSASVSEVSRDVSKTVESIKPKNITGKK